MWGIRGQVEQINDKLSEWRMIDSAGFIVPYDPNQINLLDVYKTKINLVSTRSQGYLQYNFNKLLKD